MVHKYNNVKSQASYNLTKQAHYIVKGAEKN